MNQNEDIKLLPKRYPDQPDYHEYKCKNCGEVCQNTFTKTVADRMLKRRFCFSCDLWTERANVLHLATIIERHVYTPGNAPKGTQHAGMGGRRFDIEYLSGVNAGKKITTYDLWSAGQLPHWLWERFPDNAKFLNGAMHTGNAFQNSEGNHPAYPSPSEAGIQNMPGR